MSQDIKRYDEKKRGRPVRELILRTSRDEPTDRRKGSRRVLIYLGALFVLLVLICFSIVNYERRPVLANGEFQYFEIKSGESTSKVASNLKISGLIRSRLAFILTSRLSGSSIKAGYYKLSGAMTLDDILKKLDRGEVDAFSVTIPEGYRVLQIAKVLSEKGEINTESFINAAVGTEGTLFPDTYVFPKNLEVAKIVRMMKEDYEKRTSNLVISTDQLILASIVEREASRDDERAKIAAVYKNRSDNNMLLQADPTIRYALDTQIYLQDHSVDFTFWKGITKSDYQSLNSPFNTYKQKGYPPAPICNPGLKSIQAAINPEPNFDYYYFFHDAKGEIHFSKTLDEHMKAIQEFGVSGQ